MSADECLTRRVSMGAGGQCTCCTVPVTCPDCLGGTEGHMLPGDSMSAPPGTVFTETPPLMPERAVAFQRVFILRRTQGPGEVRT